MSKICDCEGADRAYVIINPDSPDRKEVLSLSPPICHEEETTNNLVYWGNGTETLGEYSAPKDVAIATPNCGETSSLILVDWGNGDIDELTGEKWISSSIPRARAKAAGFNFSRSGCDLVEIFINFSPYDPAKTYSITFSLFGGGQQSCGGTASQYRVLREDGVDINARIYYQEHTFRGSLVANSSLFYSVQALFAFNHVPVFEVLPPLKRVTSIESGEFSERATNVSPIISTSSPTFSIDITYADNTTEDFPLDSCPEWVRVKGLTKLIISDIGGILQEFSPYNGDPIKLQCGDRQCPPETCCNPCEGSALNCCYDENGKLIDSFTRRS